jgi:hypothetical protein
MLKKINNSQGQALIELIIFLPLMITLYSVIGGFASSINGSINQQKIVRSYFYYRAQNNSTIPSPGSSDWQRWKTFGMFFIGWKDKFVNGEVPVMPCYRISIPFKVDPSDKCEEAYKETKTLWVRVGSIYGLCGATYFSQNNSVYYVPDGGGLDFKSVVDRNSCIITQ